MSVQLEHVGKKLVVKTPPSRLLSEVLNEFCVKYDMKPEEYGIQHNKKLIDLSLTFRLSGLPQNCKLEVVRRAKAAGGANGSVTIGLQVPSGERWVSPFPTSTSLWDVLRHWETQKSVAVVHTQDPRTGTYNQIVVSFMNKEVATNRELRALTLEGLGLSGGTNALLRVAYRSTQDQFELFVASDDTNATLENAERDQAESERQARVADAKEKALIAQRQQQEAQARAQHQSQEEQKRRDEERQRLVAQHEEARQRQLIAEERARERAREAEARAHASKVAEQKEREEALNAPLRPSAFVSSRISTTPVIPSTFAKEDMMDVDEPKIDRETKVLMASDTPFDISQFEFPPSFYAHTPDDMAEAMKQQRAVKAKQEADQAVMKTQAMREKERLQRLARYKRCYIRVRFPDRTELQGTFLPTEQTTDVMEFVREALREPNLPFYLYTTPPPTKLSDTKNIRDQSFLPAAQVFFGLPQGVQAPTPFLKEEFLREIKEKAPTAVGVYSAPTTLNLTAPPSSHNVGSMGNSRSSNSAQSGGGDRMDTSGGDSKAVPKWFQAGLKKK